MNRSSFNLSRGLQRDCFVSFFVVCDWIYLIVLFTTSVKCSRQGRLAMRMPSIRVEVFFEVDERIVTLNPSP